MLEEVFKDLIDLKRWVPYRKKWNPQREKFDKLPFNGGTGLSTKNPNHWMTMAEAIAIWQANKEGEVHKANQVDGIGLVMTGGIEVAGWRLIGFDYDGVDFEYFILPFPGYSEKSPSGTGIRAFAWVPGDWAVRFKDTVIYPPNCKHCEVYLGSAARFLTVTGNAI